MKTNSWTTAGQAKDISSSPNPLVIFLLRGRHWAWGPNRRRAINFIFINRISVCVFELVSPCSVCLFETNYMPLVHDFEQEPDVYAADYAGEKKVAYTRWYKTHKVTDSHQVRKKQSSPGAASTFDVKTYNFHFKTFRPNFVKPCN